jgi:hypothetical protein
MPDRNPTITVFSYFHTTKAICPKDNPFLVPVQNLYTQFYILYPVKGRLQQSADNTVHTVHPYICIVNHTEPKFVNV